jgi:hypothetical protein
VRAGPPHNGSAARSSSTAGSVACRSRSASVAEQRPETLRIKLVEI